MPSLHRFDFGEHGLAQIVERLPPRVVVTQLPEFYTIEKFVYRPLSYVSYFSAGFQRILILHTAQPIGSVDARIMWSA